MILKTLFFLVMTFLSFASLEAKTSYLIADTMKEVRDQDFQIDLKLEKPFVEIDENLKIEVTLTYPSSFTPDFEGIKNNATYSKSFYGRYFSFEGLQVLEEGTLGGWQKVTKIILTLRPMLIGTAFFSLYEVKFSNKQTTKKILSPVVSIEVKGLEKDLNFNGKMAALMTFDKAYPFELDEQNQALIENAKALRSQDLRLLKEKQLPWITALSFILSALAIWSFIKWPPVIKALTDEEKIALARQKAGKAFLKLQQKDLLSHGAYTDFYLEIDSVFKDYLQTGYGLKKSFTTPELLNWIDLKDASLQDKQKLQEILVVGDEVRFGKHNPSLSECNAAQEVAFQLINQSCLQ